MREKEQSRELQYLKSQGRYLPRQEHKHIDTHFDLAAPCFPVLALSSDRRRAPRTRTCVTRARGPEGDPRLTVAAPQGAKVFLHHPSTYIPFCLGIEVNF